MKRKFLAPSLILLAIALVLVGKQSVSKGQSDNPVSVNNYAENGIVINSGGNLGSSDENLGNSRFPNGLETPVLNVTGTSTLQEITLGSRFTDTASFAAAATTTPGGLVSLQNTGLPKICTNLELELIGVENSMVFQVSTSTSASAFVNNMAGGGLIASTTVPTATAEIILDIADDGNNVGAWLWDAGQYILGAVDAGNRNNASTTDYDSVSGNLYVTCHSR